MNHNRKHDKQADRENRVRPPRENPAWRKQDRDRLNQSAGGKQREPNCAQPSKRALGFAGWVTIVQFLIAVGLIALILWGLTRGG